MAADGTTAPPDLVEGVLWAKTFPPPPPGFLGLLSWHRGPASATPQASGFRFNRPRPPTCPGLFCSGTRFGRGGDATLAQIVSRLHAEVQVTCPHLRAVLFTPHNQGYQWLKDKILSEEGRRQQAKLKELQAIAERLGCTLPQLAIGNRAGGG